MEPELQEKIEKTVREILEESDMTVMTEFKVRKLASEKLELNLSESKYKLFVREVVTSYIEELNAKEAEEEDEAKPETEEAKPESEEEEETEEEEKQEENFKNKVKEYDDDGDLIICRLSAKRRVSIQDFKGKKLVSIREYYTKDGRELPSSKGISLTEEQWSVLDQNIPAIDKAIRQMESQL